MVRSISLSEQDSEAIEFSYPKLEFRAKGTKVVGLPTCVAQLLPIGARAFSLNLHLKAVDATNLGSKGAYGIGGLSRKKICKIQPEILLQASFPGKKIKRVGPG